MFLRYCLLYNYTRLLHWFILLQLLFVVDAFQCVKYAIILKGPVLSHATLRVIDVHLLPDCVYTFGRIIISPSLDLVRIFFSRWRARSLLNARASPICFLSIWT